MSVRTDRFVHFTPEERSVISDGLVGEWEARKNEPDNPELQRVSEIAGELLHELDPEAWR